MSKIEVFVSYAHADDLCPEGRRCGWVTTLVDELRRLLPSKAGGGGIEFWTDHRLERERVADLALMQRIDRAAAMLVVLSPAYVESNFCARELERFIQSAGRGSADERVFVVEIDEIDRDSRPRALRHLGQTRFWEIRRDGGAPVRLGWPAPTMAEVDRTFWENVNDLAHRVAKRLGGGGTAHRADVKRVWIADPTDDVEGHWNQLAHAVAQAGYEVVPASVDTYRLKSPEEFRGALARDLAEADLHVQLFGHGPGRKPRWDTVPFSLLQHAALHEHLRTRAGVRAPLIWRIPKIDLDAIEDPAYRQALTGAEANVFESFRQRVLQRLHTLAQPAAAPAQPPPAVQRVAPTVCISREAADSEVGRQLRELLAQAGIDAIEVQEPARGQNKSRWRSYFESLVADSQGVIVVHGQAPVGWVQVRVQAARKIVGLRRDGTAVALLDAPPPEKEPHGMTVSNLMVLDCRHGLAPERVDRFIAALRAGDGMGQPSHV